MSTMMYGAIAALHPELARLVAAHIKEFPEDAEEIVSEAALAWLEGTQKAQEDFVAAFARARSRVRSLARDAVRVRSVSIDDALTPDDIIADEDEQPDEQPSGPASWKRRDVVKWIAQKRGVSLRRAQQLVAAALKRAQQPQQQLSLFGGEGV